MDLSRRSMQPEEMDADSTSAETYARCIRDLAGVNRITFTHRATLTWLARATRDLPPGTSVSILDVASGYGDLLRAIRRWADKRGLALTLAGIDLNPRSAIAAAAATPPEMAIAYRTGDVFDDDPTPRPDFIVSSQFAHHLSDADVVRFVRWLDAHAARGWFIADLHRHWLAYYGFPVLARAFGWHRIVRQDGRISIARSFRRAEWLALLEAAGIPADVRWIFPFRYGVGSLR
jgi:2-polyprenyl-3-methyl-5-hydroxy-6-metoxy-1,4-benzoquinol methylase